MAKYIKPKSFKWVHPYEWLAEKISKEENISEVKAICFEMAKQLGGEEIQDIFEKEMDQDGYFEEEKKEE